MAADNKVNRILIIGNGGAGKTWPPMTVLQVASVACRTGRASPLSWQSLGRSIS